ncbi:MAG: transglutaminase family protein [Gloeomargaritaceae cyanobacterium C42_A2020_066]|nr:transglutaminase family protein [Gloeomargaritaceae cyanobacterium C42_A2020_066]
MERGSDLARQAFEQEIGRPAADLDLGRAALIAAWGFNSALELGPYLNRLDQWAAQVTDQLPVERYPLRVIQGLNRFFFETLGFRGNQGNYYDPANSFLDQVLDRRLGIPITLSLVYREVARRVGFPLVGIGLPGHFLLKPDFPEAGIFVDCFHGGELLFPEDCETLLTRVYQQPVALKPEFLEPVSDQTWLRRLLTNLKLIYLRQQAWPEALVATDRLVLLSPTDPLERRDRGIVRYQLGDWRPAADDLRLYVEACPNAEDSPAIQRLLDALS